MLPRMRIRAGCIVMKIAGHSSKSVSTDSYTVFDNPCSTELRMRNGSKPDLSTANDSRKHRHSALCSKVSSVHFITGLFDVRIAKITQEIVECRCVSRRNLNASQHLPEVYHALSN